tara:strand:+ start:427 stop:867 length:441 start_codon:yes stop_codon:yes gene_type:complete
MNISNLQDINLPNLYCNKCKKNFKNLGTLKTHLQSKSHLKNKNYSTKKKTQFINTNINTPNTTYSESYEITNLQQKLSKVFNRENQKKYIRKNRMSKNPNSVNFSLTKTKFFQNRSIIKMNRASNNLQKNILTSSRSSFIKSTLKP